MSLKGSGRKNPVMPHNKWQIDFTGRIGRSLGAAAIGDKHVTPWTQVQYFMAVGKKHVTPCSLVRYVMAAGDKCVTPWTQYGTNTNNRKDARFQPLRIQNDAAS